MKMMTVAIMVATALGNPTPSAQEAPSQDHSDQYSRTTPQLGPSCGGDTAKMRKMCEAQG